MPKIQRLSNTFINDFRTKYQASPLTCCEMHKQIGLSKDIIYSILLNERHYVRKSTFDKLHDWVERN